MSRKVSTFATVAILRPQLVSRFSVEIEELGVSKLRVESAGYPAFQLAEQTLHWRGRPVFIPTKVLFSTNEWTCTLYEDWMGNTYGHIMALFYGQLVTGGDRFVNKFNVTIRPLTGYGPHIKIPSNFVYNSPKANEKGSVTPFLDTLRGASYELSNPFMGIVLRNCYLKKIEDVRLNGADPTSPLKWNLTFRFEEISLNPSLMKMAKDLDGAIDKSKTFLKKAGEVLGEIKGGKV